MTIREQEFLELAKMLDNPWTMAMLLVLAVWSIVWKGTALWKAAKNGSRNWYIVMLVVNTVGILEIIYIFFFNKKKEQGDQNQ